MSFYPNSVPSTESTPATASVAGFSASSRRSASASGAGPDAGTSHQHQQLQHQHPWDTGLQGRRSATPLSASGRKRKLTNSAEDRWLRRSASSHPRSGSAIAAEPQGNNRSNGGEEGENTQGSGSSLMSMPPLARQEPSLVGGSNTAPVDLPSSSLRSVPSASRPSHPPHRSSDVGLLVMQAQQQAQRTQPQQQRVNGQYGYFLPQWQPDSEVTKCPICDNLFSFWFRKHHCRKCGRVVCSSCSPHRITIPRQYIVRPPDVRGRSSTMPGAPPSVSPPSQILDILADETSETSPSRINPALGGGEEVRLCNPCVPDPNPEPPRGFTALRTGGGPGDYIFHPNRSQPRQYHAMSVPSRQRPLEFFGPSQMEPVQRSEESLNHPASYNSVRDTFRPWPPSLDYSHLPYGSSSQPFLSQPLSQRPHSRRPNAGPSFSSPPRSWFRSGGSTCPEASRRSHTRTSRSERPPRPVINERDICPICNHRLPPVGKDGNEEAREAHVRDCIESHGASSRGGANSSQHPPQSHPIRMLAFTSTEKDCISHEGSAPECTICMEEYEVGQALVRLECLCKFHQRCIVDWFDRKKECPVHKIN